MQCSTLTARLRSGTSPKKPDVYLTSCNTDRSHKFAVATAHVLQVLESTLTGHVVQVLLVSGPTILGQGSNRHLAQFGDGNMKVDN
jgi:hypothetical protein